jgi:hypothetical protein
MRSDQKNEAFREEAMAQMAQREEVLRDLQSKLVPQDVDLLRIQVFQITYCVCVCFFFLQRCSFSISHFSTTHFSTKLISMLHIYQWTSLHNIHKDRRRIRSAHESAHK